MQKTLHYLTELENNNNRDWYHENKVQYKAASEEFEALIQTLIFELGKTDSNILFHDPKKLTFKVVRDLRFSHDKSPYYPAFRAHIGPNGKLPIPVGYFMMIRPGDRPFLGGGLFSSMFKDATAMIRDSIVEHGEEWEQIINAPSFVNHFTLRGEALKNVPRGYDRAHPQAEYLKNKSFYLEYPLTDAQILSGDAFITLVTRVFEAMQPFNTFLNQALSAFEMPTRP